MLVIRFNRVGRKNYAQYRLVVQENTQAPGGKHIAVVGSYNPHTKEAVLKSDAIRTYISNGAQPSDSVYNLLIREGVLEGKKRFVKVPEKKEEEKADANEDTTKTEDSATEEDGQDTSEKGEEDDVKSDVATEEKEETSTKESTASAGEDVKDTEEKESTKDEEEHKEK